MVFKSSVKALILVLTIGLLVETTSCVLAVEGDTELNHTASNGSDPESKNDRKNTKRSLEGAESVSAKRQRIHVEFLDEVGEQGNVEQVESDAGTETADNSGMGFDIASYFESDENVKTFLGLITSDGELDSQPQENEEYGESWIEGYFDSDENVRAFLEVKGDDEDNVIDRVDKTNAATQKGTFKKNKRVHTGERPYKCDYEGCEYAATQKANLERHKRVHRGEKPYKCDYEGCEYAASQQSTLDNHKRVHRGERPYKCDYEGCEYVASSSSHLYHHKRTHMKEKPYKCGYEGCEYATTQKYHLEDHKRAHIGERPYKCDYEGCEYAATQKTNLEAHKRTHTKEKPYKCDYEGCEYAASRQSTLDDHKRTHTKEKLYKWKHHRNYSSSQE